MGNTHHVKQWILIGAAVVIAGVLGYLAFNYPVRDDVVSPVGQVPTSTPTSTVPDVTADWSTYVWGDLLFKYPKDWRVVEETYATPAEQASGERGDVIGLSITNPANTAQVIMMGGRQMECAAWKATNENRPGMNAPCYTFYGVPIYTAVVVNGDEELGPVFDGLISSIRYSRAGVDFSITAPAAGEVLLPGSSYTLRWTTTPGLSISAVAVGLYAAAEPFQRVFQAESVPNTGSYALPIPASHSTQGPYFIEITQCVPIPNSRFEGDCRIYSGWSDPFYIIR